MKIGLVAAAIAAVMAMGIATTTLSVDAKNAASNSKGNCVDNANANFLVWLPKAFADSDWNWSVDSDNRALNGIGCNSISRTDGSTQAEINSNGECHR